MPNSQAFLSCFIKDALSSHFLKNMCTEKKMSWKKKSISLLVEAAGVEPASPNNLPEVPTCLVKRKSQRRKMPSDPHTSAQPAEIIFSICNARSSRYLLLLSAFLLPSRCQERNVTAAYAARANSSLAFIVLVR